MENLILSISLLLFITVANGYVQPGPEVIATKGAVWPKPRYQEKNDGYYIIRTHFFEFQVTHNTCELLQNAIIRYNKIVINGESLERRGRLSELAERKLKLAKKAWVQDVNYKGYLDKFNVTLLSECNGNEYPSLEMNEAYWIKITDTTAELEAETIWGALRGLETFTQLIHLSDDYLLLRVNLTTIIDYPKHRHRGFLLDTARHFIPLYKIYETLDAMTYNKFNVFHWHITDDQSFPFQSTKFPKLSEEGAYHPISRIFTPADVQQVIEYARQRGIRVIPEFDTPGHTRSWGVAYPELLTPCYDKNNETHDLGPLDPTKDSTYSFIQQFFEEVNNVFPDKFIHLGGDEVAFDCWASNPNVNSFMEEHNMTKDYGALETYYIQKLIDSVTGMKASSIVWEEVFTNGANLPNGTVVHLWKDDNFSDLMNNVTLAGNEALLSSCWYLDHLGTWGDWGDFYKCDPLNFPGTEEQKKLVIGGEACMWAERVDEYNVIPRAWPRACAVAEKLWSDIPNVTDTSEAARRLEEHACRMNHRGLQFSPPNGPGVCL